jgi:drug/metabolite transporter (DMT)-like permease
LRISWSCWHCPSPSTSRSSSAGGGSNRSGEVGAATLIAAPATFGAFALVLFALERASAASVAAVRETSVVIAVALAAPVLGEGVARGRLAGAVLVVIRVAMLATG